MAEFDDDEQIESVDGYHLSELKADVESDIALLYRLRDLAEVVVRTTSPRSARLWNSRHRRSSTTSRPREEYRVLIVER